MGNKMSTKKIAEPSFIMGNDSIMSTKAHGTSEV